MVQRIKDGPLVVVHPAASAYRHQLTTTHTKCGDKVQAAHMADAVQAVSKAALVLAAQV
jgi:hypothetical protein